MIDEQSPKNKTIQIVNVGAPKDEGTVAEKVLRGAEKIVKAANGGNGQPSKADLQRKVEELERARGILQGQLDQNSQRYETLLTNTIPQMNQLYERQGEKITGAIGEVKTAVNAQGQEIKGAVDAQGKAITGALESQRRSNKDLAKNIRNAIEEQGNNIYCAMGAQTEIITDEIAKQGEAVIAKEDEVLGAVNAQGKTIKSAVEEATLETIKQGEAVIIAVNTQGKAIIAKEDEVLGAVNAQGKYITNAVGKVETELTTQGKAIIAKENEVLGAVNTQGDKITNKAEEVRKAVTIQGQRNRRVIEAATDAQINATKEAAEFLSEKVIGVGDKVGEVRIAVEGITDEVKGAVTDYVKDQKSLRNKLYTAGYFAVGGAVAGLILAASSYFGKSSPNIEKTVKDAVQSSIDSSGTIESKIVKIPDVEEVQTHGHEYDKAGRLIVWARSKQPGKNPVYAQGIVENGADGLYKRLENTILPTADLTERIKFIESLTDGEGIITKTNIEARLKAYRGE
ncbi:MAG: hypothetical protein NTW67_03620 [Candidatus Woesearchaeota archaeon]|nr:hypothetical protein [Candidatus Woesearchaeota archaeon]